MVVDTSDVEVKDATHTVTNTWVESHYRDVINAISDLLQERLEWVFHKHHRCFASATPAPARESSLPPQAQPAARVNDA